MLVICYIFAYKHYIMKYIAYYRVSTKKQEQSGLGLKAQREAVENFISPELIDFEFTEIESGTNKKYRPILNEALELCKKHGATLLIAKLDRLARNVSFVSSLLDSGVKFKAVDFPEANELTIHILSAIAQHEASIIRDRIKKALDVKRKELAKYGKKLGSPQNLKSEHRLKGVEVIKNNAKNNINNKRVLAFLREVNYKEHTLQSLCNKLNSNGFKTSKGGEFKPTQVRRFLISL